VLHKCASWLAWLSPTQLWVWREKTLERRWTRRVLAGLVVLVVGAIAGAVALNLLDADPPVEARPPGTAEVRTSELALSVPATWAKSDAVLPAPGLVSAHTLVVVDGSKRVRLAAALLSPDSPTLLPRALLDQLAERPGRPERVKLGGHLSAYYYSGLKSQGNPTIQDYYVAPTTRGVAAVACFADRVVGASLDECWRAANSLRVLNGSGVSLNRDSAFLIRRDAEIRSVDTARERARSELDSATTAEAQAVAARGVSAAYANAGGVLAPLAQHSPSFLRVVAQLRANALQYQRIAADLERQDASALTRDRQSALAGEARLKRLLSE
jgi:hypothetical protein